MKATGVVEYHPFADAGARLMAARICFDMHLLVFERAPDPLDENVVHPAASSIHRDADAGSLELAREGRAGELRPLVGVEAVSYTHLRAHETRHDLVCRLL